jgi:hypothetical protein
MLSRNGVLRTIKPGKGEDPFVLILKKSRRLGRLDLSDTPRWKVLISILSAFTLLAMAAMVAHSFAS